MPPRDWLIRIRDIADAIGRIQRYTAGMSEEQFTADERTVDAVVRNLITIGEAAGLVPKDVRDSHPEVPWGEIIGMRNLVIHGYHKVSVSTVWQTVRDDLPGLLPVVQALAAQGRPPAC